MPALRLLKPYRYILIFAGCLCIIPVLFIKCSSSENRQPGKQKNTVEDLVASEEWIATINADLNTKAQTFTRLPSEETECLFSQDKRPKTITPISASLKSRSFASGIHKTFYQFNSQPAASPAKDETQLPLWNFLASKRLTIHGGKFAFLNGTFTNDKRTKYRAMVVFTANGTLEDGSTGSLSCSQEIEWSLTPEKVPPTKLNHYLVKAEEWYITKWNMTEATLTTATQPVFRDVTRQAIPRSEDWQLANISEHSRHLHTLFEGGQIMLYERYGKYFTTDATAQHPALAVVDINQDGHDDLYVCVRWGRNLLFVNQGNGTFKEEAEAYGLNLKGLTTSAIFADFDNDGDPDVFLGRSLERSLYMINDGGRFKNGSLTHVSCPLPYLTTSISAADYNNDGLLDVYLSTYGFAARNPRNQVANDFLLKDYPAEEVNRRFVNAPDVETFMNLPGPPNMLLVNTGDGKFERSPVSKQVSVWHETLQSTWADYDSDGDQDLYVCNDFAPDQLFRNDGDKGFTNVTREAGHERMLGFGMGASFGDYDNDTDLDLYVSNMYSKAGLRILDKTDIQDKRFHWSAQGNLLFGNELGRGFEYLNQKGSPLAAVTRADWSWGGQFVDFDNDSYLDLYVPNGYFTAPKDFAGEEDL